MIFIVIASQSVQGIFFGTNRNGRQQSTDMSSSTIAASKRTVGWGWSEWGQWSGSCPQVCPGNCRTRERYCSGLCGSGQPIDLSDCPDLQSPQDTNSDYPDTNDFV